MLATRIEEHHGLWTATSDSAAEVAYSKASRSLLLALADSCAVEIVARTPNAFVDSLNQCQRRHRELIARAIEAQDRPGFLDAETQEGDLFKCA